MFSHWYFSNFFLPFVISNPKFFFGTLVTIIYFCFVSSIIGFLCSFGETNTFVFVVTHQWLINQNIANLKIQCLFNMATFIRSLTVLFLNCKYCFLLLFFFFLVGSNLFCKILHKNVKNFRATNTVLARSYHLSTAIWYFYFFLNWGIILITVHMVLFDAIGWGTVLMSSRFPFDVIRNCSNNCPQGPLLMQQGEGDVLITALRHF